ncbi:MAG: hypothetical protein ACRDEA_15630, partial [Microcystaceae cyanobacterium]
MKDQKLEAALFNLLETYSLEDIIFTLFRYADIQARLAKTLQQTQAAVRWKHITYELGSIRFWQSSDAPQMSGIQANKRILSSE